MKKYFSLLTIFTALLYISIISQPSYSFSQKKSSVNKTDKENKIITDLAQTEIAFAEDSKNFGQKFAFLKFFADDAIMFNPGPVNGKELLNSINEPPGKLLWYPSFSLISGAEDLGVDLGPWERKKTIEGEPLRQGTFASVWRKQTDGSWKLILDLGVEIPKNKNEVPLFNKSVKLKSANAAPSEKSNLNYIFEIEKKLLHESPKNGFVNSYKKLSHSDLKILRDLKFTMTGREANNYLDTIASLQKWEPLGGAVSSSKDFAYTYGKHTFENSSSDNANKELSKYYLHIWVYNTDWKLLIDVASDIPEESN